VHIGIIAKMMRGRAGRRASSFVPHGDCDSPKFVCHILIKFDSSGKPLRTAPNTELLAGTIIQGTPYVATYNNGDGSFYLQGFYGNPYNIPLGAGLDYWGPTTPNSSFAFPTGQAISRTTYATLFALFGTTYGGGDGSTTFNLPDKTGRVSAMREGAATRLTPSYFGGNSTIVGAIGGVESHTLVTNEMPSHNHGVTDSGHSHSVGMNLSGNSANAGLVTQSGGFQYAQTSSTGTTSNTTGISINNAGSGNPHAIVQPTIVCNYIIRIL
jgi:microcystin-dependent protein